MIGKWCGITGIDAVFCRNWKSNFCSHIADVMGKLFFCRYTGDKFSHIRSDHVQIDVQYCLSQFFFMISDIRF